MNWKPNILVLAAIGAVLVAFLVMNTTGEAQLAVNAIAGTLIGGYVATMFLLGGPPPNPMVNNAVALALIDIIGSQSARTPEEAIIVTPREYWVLILVSIAAGVTLVMMFLGISEATVATVAGGVVGAIVSLAGKMVSPDDRPEVPASIVHELIELIRQGKDPGLKAEQ